MTNVSTNTRLKPHQLTADLTVKQFANATPTAEIEQVFIGHERAKEALTFGLSMDAPGFNVYAMGEHGTGRQTLIKQMLTATASKEPTPDEWCYINNFDDPNSPHNLYVSPGDGKQLLTRMNTFIDELMDLFPEIFDNPGYQRQKAAIDREFNQKYDQAITEVEATALKNDVVLFEENGETPICDGIGYSFNLF